VWLPTIPEIKVLPQPPSPKLRHLQHMIYDPAIGSYSVATGSDAKLPTNPVTESQPVLAQNITMRGMEGYSQ
jgi:hypothetical protein